MNRVSYLSVAANILLAASVIWLVHRDHAAKITPPAAPLHMVENVKPETTPAPSPAPQRVLTAPVFRWNQIESTNYMVYVANLRGIGCPEQTIRDIVTADVDAAIYEPERERLKQTKANSALDYALEELNQQEMVLIAKLLGQQPPADQVASLPVRVANARAQAQIQKDLERPVSLPLVLQPVDPAVAKLSDVQIQTINELRDEFQMNIGGPNQDPNDPAYRQRWQAAQRKSDEMLAAMLGNGFVYKYERQAENQAAQAK